MISFKSKRMIFRRCIALLLIHFVHPVNVNDRRDVPTLTVNPYKYKTVEI